MFSRDTFNCNVGIAKKNIYRYWSNFMNFIIINVVLLALVRCKSERLAGLLQVSAIFWSIIVQQVGLAVDHLCRASYILFNSYSGQSTLGQSQELIRVRISQYRNISISKNYGMKILSQINSSVKKKIKCNKVTQRKIWITLN